MKIFKHINRQKGHRAGLAIYKSGIEFELNTCGKNNEICQHNDFKNKINDGFLKDDSNLFNGEDNLIYTINTQGQTYQIKFADLINDGFTHALILSRS